MSAYHSILPIISRKNSVTNLVISDELIKLLILLEKINPCDQSYEICEDSLVISYLLKLNLLNFIHTFPIKLKVRVIGLPISISEKGYLGNQANVEKIIRNMKGLKIVLNADLGFENAGKTLSTFVFTNKYITFDDYLQNMRSSYRSRIFKALKNGSYIEVRPLKGKDFNENHYSLYLSIMKRTENPLEVLPMQFFNEYECELYEFINKDNNQLIAFIQLKQIDENLIFLFCGFRKEENDHNDLYYNMLLQIIKVGIEKKVKMINFGQTSEETKLKIGCKEVEKFLYIHHSNPIINMILQSLVKVFSYKPYKVSHHVFKDEQ